MFAAQWPFSVTRQKTARCDRLLFYSSATSLTILAPCRSWSTQLDLMERYPEHRFVASQAQQFKWLEEDYPCAPLDWRTRSKGRKQF